MHRQELSAPGEEARPGTGQVRQARGSSVLAEQGLGGCAAPPKSATFSRCASVEVDPTFRTWNISPSSTSISRALSSRIPSTSGSIFPSVLVPASARKRNRGRRDMAAFSRIFAASSSVARTKSVAG